LHHAFLVLEKTVGTTKEAVKGDYFLEESELGIGLLLILGLDCLFNGGMDLGVDLRSGEGSKISRLIGSLTGLNKGSLDQTGDFLDVLLSIDCSFDFSCLDAGLLLNSKYQTYWDESFSKFADS
jgi:hypothetical protein